MKVSGGIVCGGVIDGKNGNDAVVYSLEATPGSLNFRSDAVGNFTSSLQTTCKVMKTVGAGTPQQLSPVSSKYDGKYYLFYRRVKSDGTVSSPIAGTTATVSSSEVVVSSASAVYVVAIEFLLSTVAGVAQVAEDNIVKRSSVGISVDGHQGPEGPESTVPGPPGATGKMFFPMGVWSETQTYERNTLWIPLVWRDDPNTQNPATGHFGNFWYLNPDVTSSYGNDPNTDNGQHWLKANSFGLVITQGIFAEFAKLGKAIMSGDYMFSMNGCVDGSEIINGNQWKSMVAYTLFAGDPVAKAVSAGGSKTIGASDVSLHDGAIQLSAGETLVVKFVVTERVATTRLRLYVNSTAVKFDFLSSAADTSWETTSNPYLGLAVTTYFIRYTATADCSCYLRAYKTNGSGEMRYTLDRLMFEPNWWVDLLTGKMSAARGNFVVKPDGSVDVAGTIRATNLYHKVCYYFGGGVCVGGGEDVQKSSQTYGTKWFNTSGTADVIDIMQSYLGDWTWNDELNPQNYTLLLPDPSTCEGKMVTLYSRVVKLTGLLRISCVQTNKMVTQWTATSSGQLSPYNSSQIPNPRDYVDIQAARFTKGHRLANGWDGSTVTGVDLLEPVEYVFMAQKSSDGNYYWFQIK